MLNYQVHLYHLTSKFYLVASYSISLRNLYHFSDFDNFSQWHWTVTLSGHGCLRWQILSKPFSLYININYYHQTAQFIHFIVNLIWLNFSYNYKKESKNKHACKVIQTEKVILNIYTYVNITTIKGEKSTYEFENKVGRHIGKSEEII